MLNFDTIKKGDFIPAYLIEKETGKAVNDKHYPLAQLQLKDAIIKYHSNRYQVELFIKSEGDNLRVLDDKEAYTYNNRLIGNTLSRAYCRYKRNLKIDRRNLNGDDIIQYNRQIEIQSYAMQGMDTKIKKIKMEGCNGQNKRYVQKTRKAKKITA